MLVVVVLVQSLSLDSYCSAIGTGRILVPTKWPMWANTVAVPTHFAPAG
jgi:hypothetical protein